MIEVQQLTKRFGDFTAVDGVSFEAQPGEVVGLLGPNGAGKTTTMRMLTGFMPPTSGTARIAGHDILDDSLEARRGVGYLPERVPVYPDMTVGEYIVFWARLRETPNPRAATAAVLKRVGLFDRRDKLIRQLSKGMRQRLGLAQAIVHNPPVVILDEPTIGIDPQQVIEVRQTVRELGKAHTVLLSTHLLFEAEQLCDRVLIIDKGRIVAQGKPAELRRQLEPKTVLRVVIGGATHKDALALLKGVPGVEGVEKDHDGYLVRVTPGVDARGDISERVLGTGYKLLEMHQTTTSLEAIFLKVVAGEAEGAPRA